jgi:hypothetical protein
VGIVFLKEFAASAQVPDPSILATRSPTGSSLKQKQKERDVAFA